MPEIEIDCLQFAFLLAFVVTLAGIILGFRKAQSFPGLPLQPAAPGVTTDGLNPLDLLGIILVFSLYLTSLLSSTGQPVGTDLVSHYKPSVLLTSMVIQIVLASIFLMIIGWRMNVVSFLGLWWKQWAKGLLWAPVGLALIWTINLSLQAFGYGDWMQQLLQKPASQDLVRVLQQSTDTTLLITLGIAAVIVAPLTEEIVFRGYLYPAIKHFAGPGVAAFGSALLFAMAHNNLPSLLPLFLFGLILSSIYERTGSLWAPIAAHALLNGSTVAVQMLLRMFHVPIES